MTKDNVQQKFGAMALIGATNAGKSTLVNALIGEKVAITSRKVQTTRFQIRAVAMHENTQIVLVDTPGFFKPRRPHDRKMLAAAWDSLEDVDITAFLIDAAKPFKLGAHQEYLDKIMAETKPENRILILNKVDKAPRDALLKMTKTLTQACDFDQVFMVSAMKNNGVDDILKYCADKMPAGEWVYEQDILSTLSDRIFAAEITREAIYDRLHKELPYHIAVETESYETSGDGKGLALSQVIIIEDKKHKGIVLGRAGQMLKTIGQDARTQMAQIYGCPVHLKLFVQHRPNWLDSDEAHVM